MKSITTTMIGLTLAASAALAQDTANWPQFRGPNGLGLAPAQNIPAKFAGPDKANLLWKAPVALGGANSPVVWGDRIFVAGGDTEKRQLYCYGSDGKLLWSKDIIWKKPAKKEGEEEEEPELKDYVAANSPAVDGKHVYAVFGTGDVVAFDFTGKQIWHQTLWPIESMWGFCSSPLLYKDKLIVQLDHSRSSALIAFDTATGKQLWKTKRGAGDSFQSPILAQTKTGPQIITGTAGFDAGYDPETGKELWNSSAGGTDDSPSPAYGNGIAVIAHTSADTQGIDVEGKDNKKRAKWTMAGAPEVSSPVVVGDLAFVALDDRIVCLELASGKQLWENPIDEKAYASLVAVGDKVIFISQGGNVLVFKAAKTYEELLKTELGESTDATPAIANGRIYIRTPQSLLCFGSK